MSKIFGATTELDASFPEDGFNSVFIMIEDSIKHDLQKENIAIIGDFTHETTKVLRSNEITGQSREVWAVWSRVEISDK